MRLALETTFGPLLPFTRHDELRIGYMSLPVLSIGINFGQVTGAVPAARWGQVALSVIDKIISIDSGPGIPIN